MEVFNFLGPGTIGGTNGILLMILIDLNVWIVLKLVVDTTDSTAVNVVMVLIEMVLIGTSELVLVLSNMVMLMSIVLKLVIQMLPTAQGL
jgi:hypothetical protein